MLEPLARIPIAHLDRHPTAKFTWRDGLGVDEHEGFVVRLSGGGFAAYENVCPHNDTALDWATTASSTTRRVTSFVPRMAPYSDPPMATAWPAPARATRWPGWRCARKPNPNLSPPAPYCLTSRQARAHLAAKASAMLRVAAPILRSQVSPDEPHAGCALPGLVRPCRILLRRRSRPGWHMAVRGRRRRLHADLPSRWHVRDRWRAGTLRRDWRHNDADRSAGHPVALPHHGQ